jgi:hypothetical protein
LQLHATQDSELPLSILLPPENKIRLMSMEAICNKLWLQIEAYYQQESIGGGLGMTRSYKIGNLLLVGLRISAACFPDGTLANYRIAR